MLFDYQHSRSYINVSVSEEFVSNGFCISSDLWWLLKGLTKQPPSVEDLCCVDELY